WRRDQGCRRPEHRKLTHHREGQASGSDLRFRLAYRELSQTLRARNVRTESEVLGDARTRRATRRSRTGELLITNLARRFSIEFCRSPPSVPEACCVRGFSSSLLR